MINFSAISWRFLHVWKRNLTVYRKIWKVNFLAPLFEPLFYVLAFSVGFSGLINDIQYGDFILSYPQFIAPALIATAVMWNSFFETTYGSFVRMYFQKTFDGMLAAPLSIEEIIIAEIVWSSTKAGGAAVIMTAVLSILGFVRMPEGLLLIPVAVLGGLAFGAMGMFVTGITPTIDMFNLPIFLFISPMFLFCGTFFPVSNLPEWALNVAYALPLYHLAELARLISIGTNEFNPIFSALYLAALSLIFSMLAIAFMRKRLIQ
ncbi:MAG: ABC transporter permease [Spirochaetes bacterium]|jgi:lipooligosaccharide transport system permease protein|nr:ABC transporter permease [Spirochaetota bacterium]